MFKRLAKHLTPSMAVALLALLLASSGVAYSATGGTFILGQPNSATTPTTLTAPVTTSGLAVTNTSTAGGATALSLNVATGHAPLKVNSDVKVGSLNADLLDNLNSTAFVRKGVSQPAAVDAGGVVNVTNTGTANGVQGIAKSSLASGVYGQNDSGGGFGVAGRTGDSGVAVYGDNTGTGYAGYFTKKVFIGGQLECAECISSTDIAGGYVRGSGQVDDRALAVPAGSHIFLGAPMLGFMRASYACPASPSSSNGTFVLYNDSGSVANVFVDSGGANPTYHSMAAGASMNVGASSGGDSFRIQAQGALGIETIEMASVHRASECHVQAQALLTN